MRKKYNIIGVLAIVLMANVFNVVSQESEKYLPCLKKVYSVNDIEVILDCKPEDSKYIACDKFYWRVKQLGRADKVENEIQGCIKKKGGQYYLIPQKIFDRVGSQEVILEYSQFGDNGRGYSIQYQVKVIEE